LALADRLGVFTEQRNVAMAREGLRQLLPDGRIVLRPDRDTECFEGTVTFDAAAFLLKKPIDIKMVAGAVLATC
jgi:hypothetical protein